MGMFVGGYHDSDRCDFDLWAPKSYHDGCAVDNRAFSPFCKHSQELGDIVNEIVENYYEGNLHFSIDLDDSFSDSDLAYIEQEVQKRIGY